MRLPRDSGDDKAHHEVEAQDNQELRIGTSKRPLNHKEGPKKPEILPPMLPPLLTWERAATQEQSRQSQTREKGSQTGLDQ
jgi:hypothetical protein